MKSEEELDAQIEQINAEDSPRAARITLLEERGLFGFRESSLLDLVQRRIGNMEEAKARSVESGGGFFGSGARGNTKNNFVDAVHKLDKRLDATLKKRGLQGEVETSGHGSDIAD